MLKLYILPSPLGESESIRSQEALACNRKSGLFDEIVALHVDRLPPTGICESDVQDIVLPASATLRHVIDYMNQRVQSPDDIQVLAGSGVFFDAELRQVERLDLEGVCLALTPWNANTTGNPSSPSNDTCPNWWIFQGRVKPLTGIDVPVGKDDDRVLTLALRRAEYRVTNPSLTLRAYVCPPLAPRVQGENLINIPACTLAEAALSSKGPSRTGLIALSLFGEQPRYQYGAIENARLAKQIYPGWTVRFYIDESVPRQIVEQLQRLNAEIMRMPRSEGMSGLFWRFLAADDPGFTRWMIRDADSRFNYRERQAVDEWIASGMPFHTMRDHPLHKRPIMGCAFGGIRGALPSMKDIIANWPTKTRYADDELMLAQIVYPLIREGMLAHDTFASRYDARTRPFPTPYENYRFVGERFTMDEIPHPADRETLIRAITFQKKTPRS